MINLSRTVATQVTFCFSATTGLSFNDVRVVKDGTLLANQTTVILEVAPGIYKFTYTPTVTGTYFMCAGGEVRACLEVVDKTALAYLKNLEDEALGSWSWNKTTGKLTMFRQNGSTLALFDVQENLEVSSRERT